jgi:GTPase SAR1 family protein
VIIVEGPDGAGKTTLINTLKEKLNLEVAPRVVSKDAEAMVDLRVWVEKNLMAGWQPLIFDRHRLISEPIYGPILRAEWEPGFSEVDWLVPTLHQFYTLEPIIIYCLPPFKTVWDNVLSNDDNRLFHGNPQGVRAIWGAYLNKAATDFAFNKNVYLYDYTEPAYSDGMLGVIISRIKKQLVERKIR